MNFLFEISANYGGKIMYKKLSALILALTLILSACSGAPAVKLTPKETLEKIQETALAQNMASFEMTAVTDTNMEGEAASAEAAQALDMMKNLKMDIKGAVTGIKEGEFAMNLDFTVDMNGLAINAGGYLDSKELIVNYPMLGKLVVVNFEELMTMAKDMAPEEATEQLKPELVEKVINDYRSILVPKLSKYMIKNIPDESLVLEDEHVFTYKEEEIKAPALKMSLNAEQYVTMMKGLITDLSNDEEIYNALKSYEIPEFPATFDEYKMQITDLIESEDFKKAFEQFSAEGNEMQVDAIYGYDKDYLVTVAETKSNSKVNNEEQELKMDITQTAVAKMNYKDVKVEKPEVTEENSMGLQELMMMFMGGMPPQ